MNPSAYPADSVPTNGLLLLVDGHAYAYRAFYAIRHLRSPSSAPVNAIYGFIRMLNKIRARLNPGYAAVVWDGGLAAERVEAWPSYKAQRPPMPVELEEQLDGIVEWLKAAGWKSLRADGVEADDWIAGLAREAAAADMGVVIASADKDFMQLDELYARFEELQSPRLRSVLLEAEPVLRRNQELIRLRDESRAEAFRAEDFSLKPGRREELRSLYARWGFSISLEDGTDGAGRLGGTPSELAGGTPALRGGDARATWRGRPRYVAGTPALREWWQRTCFRNLKSGKAKL
jgi:5'-3' exonuclease